jgi:putative molybdenum carrier protein
MLKLRDKMKAIPKIVSGGQTGADREPRSIGPCLMICPAVDGARGAEKPKSPSASYLQRTEWNVRDCDATVLFSIDPILSGGSRKTVEFARKHNKPCLHLHSRQRDAAERFASFLEDNEVHMLNVAGPRASKEPNVAQFVRETLDSIS